MGGRRHIVSGLPRAHRGPNDTTSKYREPTFCRLGPKERKTPGGDQPIPLFFLPARDHSEALSLQLFLEKAPHAKRTHLLITCCVTAACGEAMAPPPSEASFRILFPLSWPHFPLFSLSLPYTPDSVLSTWASLRASALEFLLKLCCLEDPD